MMYLDSVVDQAEDRVTNHMRAISDFIDLRRNNTGVRPCLFIGTMHLNISDTIREHRFLVELEVCLYHHGSLECETDPRTVHRT